MKMINEYDKVRIKSNGIAGVVVDIYSVNGGTRYTVESESKDAVGGYGIDGYWKLFTCTADELEKI